MLTYYGIIQERGDIVNTEKNGVGGINIEKFPSLLRDKLKDGQIQFPENTQFEYMPILGYRMIMREDCNDIRVTREDFRSHAELGILVRGVRPEDIPEYYGASVYKDKKNWRIYLNFRNPEKFWQEGMLFKRVDRNQQMKKPNMFVGGCMKTWM